MRTYLYIQRTKADIATQWSRRAFTDTTGNVQEHAERTYPDRRVIVESGNVYVSLDQRCPNHSSRKATAWLTSPGGAAAAVCSQCFDVA